MSIFVISIYYDLFFIPLYFIIFLKLIAKFYRLPMIFFWQHLNFCLSSILVITIFILFYIILCVLAFVLIQYFT